MDLLPFQIQASTQIAERLEAYMQLPNIPMKTRTVPVPFYQGLSAITGGGKTLILADAVEQIRSHLAIEPIVLWLSKGKVVVWQTYANLSTGRYADLLGGFDVKPLLDCTPDDVRDASRGLLLIATTGKFNQKDKEKGDRKIFRVGLDDAEQSLWAMLRQRLSDKKQRRPFIIVYDEGHNLSDQQTGLLLELEPDAIIAASATSSVPEVLSYTIGRIKNDAKWKDEDFVTAVPSSAVVQSGLIKKHLMMGGYVTPMEVAVDDMLAEMNRAEQAITDLGLNFKPAAIYVSRTNTADGASSAEDAARPFKERLARPILIWRYLTEEKGIDPLEIAVYCNLAVKRDFPLPKSFNLFSGGDDDYENFIRGNYRHIIFNLGLQEGWDDPRVAFAYIDKEMGSPDQVTQVVGRVLRQPGAEHYPAPILNTAHFYIRADEKKVFNTILDDVRKKMAVDLPDVSLSVRQSRNEGSRPYKPASKLKEVPTASIDTAKAFIPIKQIIDKMIDFRGESSSKTGGGSRIQVLQTIGSGEDITQEWVEVEHSNLVTVRWVFLRELQRFRKDAALLVDLENGKFDARVEYHSDAADHIREIARKVAKAFIEHSEIVQNALDYPYVVADISVNEERMELFRNSLHEGYSDLNGLELEFAKAIDKTRRVWCRNPSQGGYSIPLLDNGKTKQFFPDFLVWADKKIVAIDTKGDHLITDDANRKLLHIRPVEEGYADLVLRLVTEGKWGIEAGYPKLLDKSDGFTVWILRHGKPHPVHCENAVSTVEACLSIDEAVY